MMRLGSALLALLLVGCGCSAPAADEQPGAATPTALATASPSAAPSTTPAPSPPSGASDSEVAEPAPDPVSLPAMMQASYEGRALRLGAVRERTAAYVSHDVTYRSGGLLISGVINIPNGPGPFPAAVLAHGYIDPAIYVSGQGMTRERAVLAEAGYIALHVDYRNHAGSDDDPDSEIGMRLGYTEDVIGAVLALRAWEGGPVDADRIGLVGRSMGGGVVYNVLTVQPGLVGAAVVFAPVSSDAVDNFERWVRPNQARAGLTERILGEHGDPDEEPVFWRNLSARTFFDRVTEPVMIHHGTLDDSCPIAWSDQTVAALEDADVAVRYHVYEGEGHAFGPQFDLSMRRTIDFLDRQL